MRFAACLLLPLILLMGCATRTELRSRFPVAETVKIDGKPVLFGARRSGRRIGIAEPHSTYLLNRPIDVLLYFDSAVLAAKWPAESPNAGRLKVGCGLNPKQYMPGEWFGTDSVYLTLPDGSVTAFPADTRIDGLLGRPEFFWETGQGINMDYQLENFVHTPGVYRMRWKMGDVESPEVSFQVVGR